MKRFSFFCVTIFLMGLFACSVHAAGFEQTGEYYRYYYDDGSVAYNEIVEVDRRKYYCNENGYAVFNSWVDDNSHFYYAGKDGAFLTDGKYKIDQYYYYFNYEGELQKGWIEDNYYACEDGFLVNGFQELEIPKGWSTELTNESTGWFYFDTNTCKKFCATNDAYATKIIGGTSKYCFDQNGIVRTGWRQIKEDTKPIMKGYMYFVEEATDEFKYGEAVTNSWYAVEPPAEVLPTSEVRYFYFNGSGQPRTAQEGKFIKVNLKQGKSYCFNEYGFAIYGIHEVDGEYYYFGNDVEDCSMKTGEYKKDIDESGDVKDYYFLDNGAGFTGVYKNKLYYKGKLQAASKEQKYAAIKVDNLVRLVTTSGTLAKNKHKVKDGDDYEWSTNDGGVVTYRDDGASLTDPNPPQPTSEY